ncbi:MAG: class I SAM-dependent methyltransferase [bacterium]
MRQLLKTLTRTEIINTLIKKNNYKTYLEIGVNTPAQPGYSHTSINIETKHGVDPAVDTTFQMTSDEFFASHIQMKYDIIFIDGLHLFEQAYKDIINGLEWLNDGGTIVVHDCNPTREITQRRERASSVWHGDVWKAILKLRTENPDVQIYTIDADEGCAIIQKGSQKLFTSTYNTENIYTYNFFNKNRKGILNLINPRVFEKEMKMEHWLKRKIKSFTKKSH